MDWLRFEYEKRQRSIQALQIKIARLSREREEMFDLNEEIMKSGNPHSDALNRAISIGDDIKDDEREISTAEEEMKEIQQALDRKADDNAGKDEMGRLRFEYEKRQRSIQALQTKIARLSREREEMFDLNEKIMKSDNAHSDALNRAISIGDEISACKKEIGNAEEEMKKIQKALDTEER